MAKQKVTSFCANWQDMVFTHIDGVEEKYKKYIFGDPYRVRCDLCKGKPFSVASGGIADCKQHAKGANHRKLMKDMSTQRTYKGV